MTTRSASALGPRVQRLMAHLHTGAASNLLLRLLTESGMTTPQMAALTFFRRNPEASLSDAAGYLDLSLPSTSQLVDRLAARGWVERRENPEDRRQRRLTVTPEAAEILDRLNAARAAQYEAVLARLPAPLRKELADVIERVVAALDAPHGVGGAQERNHGSTRDR